MRNILKYPVQKSEVIEALKQAAKEESDKKLVGGLSAMILSDLANILENDHNNVIYSQMIDKIDHYCIEWDELQT